MNQSHNITQLKEEMTPFEKGNKRSSIKQLLNTLLPLVLLWYAAYLSLSVSYWLTVPIAIVTAGFLVRTFIIFHDCCHGSFFKSKRANEIVGTIMGIFVVVPFQQWKLSHNIHHATSSNLDKRGTGDMWVLTVKEYKESSLLRRIYYNIYRNPIFMFGLGPILIFLIQYRFNTKKARRKERINTYITNISIGLLYGLLIWTLGLHDFLLIQSVVFLVSGSVGIWMFYVQHQFEDSYFEHEEQWSYVNAAVDGSSYYKLPRVLQWITGNIGFHHVHHLSPRVPNYNLEKAHNASIPLQKATTITFSTSLKSLNFRLWDEQSKTFISFKKMKRLFDQSDTLISSKYGIKAKKIINQTTKVENQV
jgi:omega-6 fatty acid desaturase (delta-12 desaturase)